MKSSGRGEEVSVARRAAIPWLLLLAWLPGVAPGAEPEPNGTRAGAPSISGDANLVDFAAGGVVVVEGELGSGDIDHFAFGVRASEPLSIALFGADRGAFFDPLVVVFDSGGTELARNDDGGPGFFSRLSLVPAADDVYTVAVTRFPDGGLDGEPGDAFGYQLVVAVNGPAAVLDADVSPGPQGANDGVGSAQALLAGGSVAHGELVAGDSDFYAFLAQEGDVILVSLFDDAGGERNDSVVRLYRAGAVVAGDDDGGAGFLSNLDRKVGPGEGGAFQVEVTGFAKNPPLPHTESFGYQLVVATAPGAVTRRACDVNADAVVDRSDVDAIFAARGTPASGPDDVRDDDGDGQITILDARACTQRCDQPDCAPPPQPLCGLLGPELLLALLPFGGRLRRGRDRERCSESGPCGPARRR